MPTYSPDPSTLDVGDTFVRVEDGREMVVESVDPVVVICPVGRGPTTVVNLTFSLTYSLYVDDDQSGDQSPGDTPVSGAQVDVLRNGVVVATLPTGVNGTVNFTAPYVAGDSWAVSPPVNATVSGSVAVLVDQSNYPDAITADPATPATGGAAYILSNLRVVQQPDGTVCVEGAVFPGDPLVFDRAGGVTGEDGSTTVSIPAEDCNLEIVTDPFTTPETAQCVLLTANSGLVVYDDCKGPPVAEWQWKRLGQVVSYDEQYTPISVDSTFGLTLCQTIHSSEGASSREVEIIPPIPYTEQAVRQQNPPLLLRAASLPATAPGYTVFFSSTFPTIFASGARGRLVAQSHTGNGNLIIIQSNGLRLGSLVGGDNQFFTIPVTAGSRLSILSSLHPSGAWDAWAYDHGTGIWSSVGSNTLPNTSLFTGQWDFMMQNAFGQDWPWEGDVSRFAVFGGAYADPSQTAGQQLFVKTSGDLANPSASAAVLGAPLIDFHGDASRWNTATHDGSASFSVIQGAVANAP